uniref:Uncharacterized protein n=1 Tax=Zea mays TaxID=4577 RepID=B6TI47_MAIZE|nr:hypothetical protein [Zea mays]
MTLFQIDKLETGLANDAIMELHTITEMMEAQTKRHQLCQPAEALARSGEHGRHACTGGGGVQRQKRLHAEARLDGRPGRVTSVSPPRQSSTTLCLAYYSIRKQAGSRVAAGGAVPEKARRSSQCAPKRRTRGSRGSREGGGGAKKGGRRAEQRPYGGHRAWWGGGGDGVFRSTLLPMATL